MVRFGGTKEFRTFAITCRQRECWGQLLVVDFTWLLSIELTIDGTHFQLVQAIDGGTVAN